MAKNWRLIFGYTLLGLLVTVTVAKAQSDLTQLAAETNAATEQAADAPADDFVATSPETSLTPEAETPQTDVPKQPKPAWMDYKDPYVGEQNDVANANKTGEEVTTWVQGVATEAMTYAPEDINAKILEAKKSFTTQGWTEYSEYIRASKMLEFVRDKNYSITTIFNGDAMVVSSGSEGGKFTWAIKAPLLITYLKPDAENPGRKAPVGSANFNLVIRVARVAGTAGKDGLAVDNWRVEAPPRTR